MLLTPNAVNPIFSWTGPNSFLSTSDQINNLSPGNYSVIVNDDSNCPTQLNLTVTEPPVLDFTFTTLDESCENYSDGEVLLQFLVSYTRQFIRNSNPISM